MSKQPRQTVRKEIRINEEKSILGKAVPLPALPGKVLLARPALSLLGEKVFKHETGEEVAVSAVGVRMTNPQFTLSKWKLLKSAHWKGVPHLSAASR